MGDVVPIEEWAAATRTRRSHRRYTGEPPTAEQSAALTAHCESFKPMPGARVVFVAEPAVYIFKGIVGSYWDVLGAPSALVFIADTAVAGHAEHLGYAGEAAVLEATRLGLDTCWVAGSFDRRKAARLVEMARTERVLAASPVGIASDDAKTFKRKSLPEIAPGIESGRWPAWVFDGVELARFAPSAMNRQPWRFRLEDDACAVSAESGPSFTVSKRLDCGIAMLHFEIGAALAGGIGVWEPLEAPDVARYRLARFEQEVADERP